MIVSSSLAGVEEFVAAAGCSSVLFNVVASTWTLGELVVDGNVDGFVGQVFHGFTELVEIGLLVGFTIGFIVKSA